MFDTLPIDIELLIYKHYFTHTIIPELYKIYFKKKVIPSVIDLATKEKAGRLINSYITDKIIIASRLNVLDSLYYFLIELHKNKYVDIFYKKVI